MSNCAGGSWVHMRRTFILRLQAMTVVDVAGWSLGSGLRGRFTGCALAVRLVAATQGHPWRLAIRGGSLRSRPLRASCLLRAVSLRTDFAALHRLGPVTHGPSFLGASLAASLLRPAPPLFTCGQSLGPPRRAHLCGPSAAAYLFGPRAHYPSLDPSVPASCARPVGHGNRSARQLRPVSRPAALGPFRSASRGQSLGRRSLPVSTRQLRPIPRPCHGHGAAFTARFSAGRPP